MAYDINIKFKEEVVRLEEAIWDLLLVAVSVLLGKALDIADKAIEQRKTSRRKHGKHERRS